MRYLANPMPSPVPASYRPRPTAPHRLLAVASVMFAAVSTAHAQWSVVYLQPGGAAGSLAYAVRDGQVAGTVQNITGGYAALWDANGGIVNLNPFGTQGSSCLGMAAGSQVGVTIINGYTHASLWNGSAASWVDLSPAGTLGSACLGVDGNQQVGTVAFGNASHATLWTGSAASNVDLNPAGATQSEASAVAAGQQVGTAYVPVLGFRASMWTGSAASWVDLTPFFGTNGFVNGTDAVQQVGQVLWSSVHRASVWTGDASTWQSLHPIGAAESCAYGVHGGQQVGSATIIGAERACIWSGTPASWVDLHAFLPADFIRSRALSIWHEGTTTYVAGYGYNQTLFRNEALLWVSMPPTNYGVGCAGTGGLVPTIASVGLPLLGNNAFAVRVSQGLPNSACLLLAGFAPTSVSVGACTLLVAQPSVNFVGPTDGSGAFTFGLPIPAVATLAGFELYWQGLVVDPLGPLLGLASASDGLHTRLGF